MMMLTVPRDTRTGLLAIPAKLFFGFEVVYSGRLARSRGMVFGTPVVGFRVDGRRFGHYTRECMRMLEM
jgi:hypothetical protein